MSEVTVGTTLPPQSFRVTRFDLLRYAGASGDFNPIHWNERTARAVGLPGVIAHGMFTMALAGRYLTDWAGDPAALELFRVRFSAPVVVPDDDDGTAVTLSGAVVEQLADGRVRLEVEAAQEGRVVLRGAAVVRRRPAGTGATGAEQR